MLEKLVGMADGQWFVALLVVGGLTGLAKGLFNLRRSSSQDRRDFLELWSRRSSDDLWLEVAVRHQFGSYLPAALIRRIQLGPQAGRALLDVATAWELLDMSDKTGKIQWRAKRHQKPRHRQMERWVLMALYVMYAFVGFMLGYLALGAKSGALTSWVVWLYVVLFVGAAFYCLARHDTLVTAERAMERWIRLAPRVERESPHAVADAPATSSPALRAASAPSCDASA